MKCLHSNARKGMGGQITRKQHKEASKQLITNFRIPPQEDLLSIETVKLIIKQVKRIIVSANVILWIYIKNTNNNHSFSNMLYEISTKYSLYNLPMIYHNNPILELLCIGLPEQIYCTGFLGTLTFVSVSDLLQYQPVESLQFMAYLLFKFVLQNYGISCLDWSKYSARFLI